MEAQLRPSWAELRVVRLRPCRTGAHHGSLSTEHREESGGRHRPRKNCPRLPGWKTAYRRGQEKLYPALPERCFWHSLEDQFHSLDPEALITVFRLTFQVKR